MLLDTDRDKSIDLIGEKESVFCRTHIAGGHRIQGGSPGPLRLKYAVGDTQGSMASPQQYIYVNNFAWGIKTHTHFLCTHTHVRIHIHTRTNTQAHSH